MPHPEHVQLLETCQTPDSGCLASDPESLDALVDFHDSVVRANLESALASAAKAGRDGIPVDRKMYKKMILKQNGSSLQIRGGGSEQIIGEVRDDVDRARHRLAACAHACGAAALCPIMQFPDSNK